MGVNKDWFVSWFDTEYYHMLYRHRDHNEATRFVERLVNFMKLPPNSKWLDLGCGKGRHSVALSKFGYSVLGVDLSSKSISVARQFENENLHFIVQDMRKVVKSRDFDAVLSLFTSFGYFEDDFDNKKVIESVSEMLVSGGYFCLDFLNTNLYEPVEEPISTKRIEHVLFETQKVITNQAIIKRINVIDGDKTLFFQEYIKKYDLNHLSNWFQEFGLRIEHVFGDYELNQYQKDSSPRMILLATKF